MRGGRRAQQDKMVGEGNEEVGGCIIVATERTTSPQFRLFMALFLRPIYLCVDTCFYFYAC